MTGESPTRTIISGPPLFLCKRDQYNIGPGG